MSSRSTESIASTHSADDDNIMSVDPQQSTSMAPSEGQGSLAFLVRDELNWLSSIRSLQDTDAIVFITPVVVPVDRNPADVRDPFEPLGRALARIHSRIRHVPYTLKNGITSTHIGFIKRSHAVVLCYVIQPGPGQQIPLELAQTIIAVSDSKPCIVVVCDVPPGTHQYVPFPTVIQTLGYSRSALETTAGQILGNSETPPSLLASEVEESSKAKLWSVSLWNETRDMLGILNLWNESINSHFSLDVDTLASLLHRPGYAKHYVVRHTESGDVLGFCATYLSYVDQEGEKLIASLALLLVQKSHRGQGVGLSLYSHAVGQLKKTRGVIRLQLGSTFPRILYGLPIDVGVTHQTGTYYDEDWFRRRGWKLNTDLLGEGQEINDLLLKFEDWAQIPWTPNGAPLFEPCSQQHMVKALEMVKHFSSSHSKMGWFDQYAALIDGPNVKDIVIGMQNGAIVAVALTYTSSCGSQVASNLPWANRIGHDVGGVTCICTLDEGKEFLDHLLEACVKLLRDQGMGRMFVDGVAATDSDDFINLGFQIWARYRDVWKDV